MKCNECNGSGHIVNKQYYRYSQIESYERGIQSTIKCKQCNGSGFIIDNLNEATNVLEVAINTGKGLTLKQTKELLVFLRNH